MATIMSLEDQLARVPLNTQTKQKIIHNFWPATALEGTISNNSDWEPYFDYYEDQCHHALHEQGKHILVRTHQHVIDITSKLVQGQSRAAVKTNLKCLFISEGTLPNEDEILNNSVDLAARLRFMVNIGANTSTATRCEKLLWDSSSLKDFIYTCFNEPQVLSHSNVRLEKTFTAINMERVADMKICWTNNLADHLRMLNDDDKVVAIFHHASFLECQKDSPMFPPGLIAETIRTLALIFPRHDKQTKRMLQVVCPSELVDRRLQRLQKLHLDDRQIETFKFWRDRLIILKQAFDDSRPAKLSQWWYDRRDGHVWYTFWVAVLVLLLTVFFGIIQSIEGALQVYKAYNPTNR
ncbi:hypothetical protein HBI81_077310 [Parastagonospora nodorum]|nr:hypothetical protein HBH53_014510 [Parastagonospora nodorum]KAH5221836.1 hypothetical protein HBI62_134700 [Parastagonospora nodorum]KAH6157566.1 hypothetical protein HBI63_073630 [Parastagonospora nodorum]KAH6177305.1 hypothetical protein HBI61_127130 [Parastagonospora nodorum]KAH6534799.1 hypothetical protein HBI81_077310 [Parastagonospora nodorum]